MWEAWERAWYKERNRQCGLVHDIFGNPFRPIAVDSGLLSPSVVKLAHTIYEDRAFDRMPALADGLEQAGCANADVLDHCRVPGPHVRGCWVIDAVLGKRCGAGGASSEERRRISG